MLTTQSLPPRRIAAVLALMLVSSVAMAGGLESGTQAANNFKIWFYSFVGIVAVIYLLYVGVQCFGSRGDWVHDFGGACIKVAAVGSVIVLAPWLWSLGAS